MIDIIIPTLLKTDIEIFNYSLYEAERSPYVNKIIVIDNTGLSLFRSDLTKIQIVCPNQNIFVNPSWNLGVSLSSANNIVIMNDDIACHRDNYKFIEEVLNDDACGLCSISTDAINNLTDYTDKVIINYSDIITTTDFQNQDNNKTGWFFATKKRLWKDIPDSIKIIYGDDLIYMRIRNLGLTTKNIINTSIGHLYSKTVNQVMNNIISQVNNDILQFHRLKNNYIN